MNYSTATFRRPAIVAICYGLLLLIEFNVTRSIAFQRQPELLAGAVLVDLVILPAVLFYWLVIKPMAFSKTLQVAATLILLRVALFVLPAGVAPFTISWTVILVSLEIGVLALTLVRVRTLRRNYRTLRLSHNQENALQGSLESVFGRKIASLIVCEIQVLRFSLLGWWRLSSDILSEQQAITTHRESGQIALMITLLSVCLIEVMTAHLLLARWNPAVAFFVTLLSAYGMLFLIADLVATYTRPSFLTSETLHLRLGIRWQAVILRSNIAGITSLTEKPAKESGLLNGVLLITPNTLLTLREPIFVKGPYGICRQVQKIALFIDDKESLCHVIGQI